MGKERQKRVEFPEYILWTSEITLVTYTYCNTMHGTMNLKQITELGSPFVCTQLSPIHLATTLNDSAKRVGVDPGGRAV
jgi:hypothetical protein